MDEYLKVVEGLAEAARQLGKLFPTATFTLSVRVAVDSQDKVLEEALDTALSSGEYAKLLGVEKPEVAVVQAPAVVAAPVAVPAAKGRCEICGEAAVGNANSRLCGKVECKRARSVAYDKRARERKAAKEAEAKGEVKDEDHPAGRGRVCEVCGEPAVGRSRLCGKKECAGVKQLEYDRRYREKKAAREEDHHQAEGAGVEEDHQAGSVCVICGARITRGQVCRSAECRSKRQRYYQERVDAIRAQADGRVMTSAEASVVAMAASLGRVENRRVYCGFYIGPRFYSGVSLYEALKNRDLVPGSQVRDGKGRRWTVVRDGVVRKGGAWQGLRAIEVEL